MFFLHKDKVRTLRWGGNPRLSRWALNVISSVFMRRRLNTEEAGDETEGEATLLALKIREEARSQECKECGVRS